MHLLGKCQSYLALDGLECSYTKQLDMDLREILIEKEALFLVEELVKKLRAKSAP